MSARPTYSDEFKADAVALVISSGRSPASVARELEISVTALKPWVRLHNEGRSEGGGKPDDPVDPAKYRALEALLREVERENDFLKKFQRSSPENNGRGSLPPCSGEERAVPRPVDVSAAGYSRASSSSLAVEESPTTTRHRELTGHVRVMFDSSDGIFGHRMLHTKLAAAGNDVSVGTVAVIMAENGWAAKRMRAFKRTTIPSDPDKVFADLIGRDFTSAAPGTRLVEDITYLRTGEGWLYLATVIDLCMRMVVGWAMADHVRASLTTGALKMARDRGHLQPEAIFHSDRGTQYTSREMSIWCTGNGIRQSMGATGVCWDCAVAESAFSSLKNEFHHHHSFTTRQEARRGVMKYIEVFYNRWRPHSNNDGLPPATAMAAFMPTAQPLPETA